MDQRAKQLAQNLVEKSMKVQSGENVWIEGYGIHTFGMIDLIIEEVVKAGGRPFVSLHDNVISHTLLQHITEDQIKIQKENEFALMKQMDCFVAVRGVENDFDESDISSDKLSLFDKYHRIQLNERVTNTKWVILRWPSQGAAQAARMSLRSYEDFFFNACLLDYSKLAQDVIPLQELMNKTDKVRIVSPGTDLTFSIKDIPSKPCTGMHNIPDGEIFTAPVRDSVQGYITYNTPTPYNGEVFDGVRLEFKDGKIVNAACVSGSEKRLNEILDSDDGARYIGEFAIGLNNKVTQPSLSILFDEKIGGSIHFTPGEAYAVADNGNRSQIHWDMVLRQTSDLGGGEIYFDDVLIRKDGLFTLPELEPLNP